MYDERFVRMWRMYLAGSIAAFESGSLQLFQVLFARPLRNTLPLTRAHMYAHLFEAAPPAAEEGGGERPLPRPLGASDEPFVRSAGRRGRTRRLDLCRCASQKPAWMCW